jgi:hypothetical protein
MHGCEVVGNAKRAAMLASAEVVEIRSDARHGVAVKAGVVIGSIG